MEMLLRQAHIPEDSVLAKKVPDLVKKLTEKVVLWEMECNKEPEAAKVAYGAMSAAI
jgi:hypothetical protein